jgi:hypothetical protein
MTANLHGPANAPLFNPPGQSGPTKIVVPAKGGLPAGGTTGQALTKASNVDYDTEWTTVSGGPGGAAAEAQFGYGGLVAPTAEAKSAPYVMASALTFTKVVVGMSTVSATSYSVRVYVNGTQQTSFTVPASTAIHTQTVSIAVAVDDYVQVSIGAAPLATGENVLVVCR